MAIPISLDNNWGYYDLKARSCVAPSAQLNIDPKDERYLPITGPEDISLVRGQVLEELEELEEAKRRAENLHFRQLELNGEKREKTRKAGIIKELEILDQTLAMIDRRSPTLWQRFKAALFGESVKVYFQVKNRILLDGAEKAVRMYYLTRGEGRIYLEKAKRYLALALSNYERASFDNSRDVLTLEPSKRPVEAYFELKIQLFQVLSLTDHKAALELGKEIESELADFRLVEAQRSNPDSARGYRNSLRVLYAFAGIYNPEMLPEEALQHARTAQQWAAEKHDQSIFTLWAYGMNKKDLRYDNLASRAYEGRLLIKLNRYDEARQIFESLLREPQAIRKFGGFLDIGLQAFFGLLQIALATSHSIQEAAGKFDQYIAQSIGWDKFNSEQYIDLRESMGLVIREERRRDKAAKVFTFTKDSRFDVSELKLPDPEDDIGAVALYLDWPSLSPEDDTDLKSVLSATDNYDAKGRVHLFMRLIDYAELPFDQKQEIVSLYRQLVRGRKP